MTGSSKNYHIKKKTKTERIIDYIFRHLYRVAQLGPIYTPILLLINMSLGIWVLIEYRGIHPYVAIPLVFFGLLAVILSISFYLIDVVQVQRNQKRAEYTYNPTMNMSYTPFQQNQLLGIYLPIMKYLIDGDDKELKIAYEKVRRWGVNGFIDPNDVPDELKEYYKLKAQRI